MKLCAKSVMLLTLLDGNHNLLGLEMQNLMLDMQNLMP